MEALNFKRARDTWEKSIKWLLSIFNRGQQAFLWNFHLCFYSPWKFVLYIPLCLTFDSHASTSKVRPLLSILLSPSLLTIYCTLCLTFMKSSSLTAKMFLVTYPLQNLWFLAHSSAISVRHLLLTKSDLVLLFSIFSACMHCFCFC